MPPSLPFPKWLLLTAVAAHFCIFGHLALATSYPWDGNGIGDRLDTPQNWSGAIRIGSYSGKGGVVFTANKAFTGSVTINAGTFEVHNTGSLVYGSPMKPTGARTSGVGTLTLQANRTIDFTSRAGRTEALCQNLRFVSGTVANIANWTNNAGTDGLDGSLLGTKPGLTTKDMRFAQFRTDADINLATGGMILDYDRYDELVPTAVLPEPATWVGGGVALLSLLFARGRRTRRAAGANREEATRVRRS
jgi:autotransporter-associated beta strand protein